METRGAYISVKRISQAFFLAGVFLKQFYIFRSGSFQIGDAMLMLSMLMLLFVRDRDHVKAKRQDFWLIAFVACTVLINGIYVVIYGFSYTADFHFHMSILNYIYVLLVALVFRQFCEDTVFLGRLRWVLQAAVLFQFVVCVLNLRPRYADVRFVGTFNDPNQCAFYLMSAFFLIYLISRITGKGIPWIWYVPAFYCIIETSSTGMMLGLIVFLGLAVLLLVFGKSAKTGIALVVLAAVIFSTGVLVVTDRIRLADDYQETLMYQRFMGKLASFGIEDGGSDELEMQRFVEDRSLEKLVKYPEKIFFGAGEGYYERLPASESSIRQELHSSILGPLFYYGVIPCAMWFLWTAIQLKGIKRELWSVYLALIVECFTLVNNRQPFFWMIFVLAGSCLAKKHIQEEREKEAPLSLAGMGAEGSCP